MSLVKKTLVHQIQRGSTTPGIVTMMTTSCKQRVNRLCRQSQNNRNTKMEILKIYYTGWLILRHITQVNLKTVLQLV